MNPAIELKLNERARDDMGIYPVSVNGVERSEYGNGWNAALSELGDKEEKYAEWFQSLPDDIRPAVETLLLSDDVYITLRDDKPSLFVLCNDLFAWGCADAEDLPDDHIHVLAALIEQDTTGWASQKWCCIRRNMQPQRPIVEMWKEAGAWDETMEALPHNPIDGLCPPTCSIHRPEDAAAINAA